MSVFRARGQPPNGDGPDGGNASNTDGSDSAPGNLSDDPEAWWWSSSAEAVKWAIIAGIFVVFLLCLTAAYYHAKRRMSNGLQPLPYHRWLVRRQQRMQFVPQNQNNFSFYGHNMPPYNMPPPAYNAEHDYVPPYAPPTEGSKIKMKDETTVMVTTESGPSQPPPVADPARPMYS